MRKGREDLFHELHLKEFTPFLKKTRGIGVATAGATVDADENEEKSSDYEYLLSLSIECLTQQKIQDLSAEKQKLKNLVEELENTSPKALWLRDLDALEKQLDEPERKDDATKMQEDDRKEVDAKALQGRFVGRTFQGAAVPTEAPEKHRKDNAIKGTATDADLGSTDPDKSTVVESGDDEDDDEDAYNLDSSPDQTSQEVLKKKAPSKIAAAWKCKSTLMISDDDDDTNEEVISTMSEVDTDFQMVDAPKGKKATAMTNREERWSTGEKTSMPNASPREEGQEDVGISLQQEERISLGESPEGSMVESEGSIGFSPYVNLEAVPVERNVLKVFNCLKRENRTNVLHVGIGYDF